MGHWLRPDGSDLQDADITDQATGHEVGPGQRRGDDESDGVARKRPMGCLLGARSVSCSLMPQKMVTPFSIPPKQRILSSSAGFAFLCVRMHSKFRLFSSHPLQNRNT